MDFLSKHTISKEFSHGALFTIIEHIRIRFNITRKDSRKIWGRRLHSHRIYNWAYVFLFLCPEIEPVEMNYIQQYGISYDKFVDRKTSVIRMY